MYTAGGQLFIYIDSVRILLESSRLFFSVDSRLFMSTLPNH